MKNVFYLLVVGLSALSVGQGQVIDGQFPVASNLKAGVAKVDIAPGEVKDITVTGHTRVVNGVRDPLRTGVLVLDDGETKAAIVTPDVIGAWEDHHRPTSRSSRRSSTMVVTAASCRLRHSPWAARTTTPPPKSSKCSSQCARRLPG